MYGCPYSSLLHTVVKSPIMAIDLVRMFDAASIIALDLKYCSKIISSIASQNKI